MNSIISIISVIISVVFPIVGIYLGLYLRWRRKQIIEIARFCIIPLIVQFESMRGYRCEVFDMSRWLSGYKDAPPPKVIEYEFESLVRKMRKLKEWKRLIEQYNKVCKECDEVGKKLKEVVLEELKSEAEEIGRMWEKAGRPQSSSLDDFMKLLAQDFYRSYYEHKHRGAEEYSWRHVGVQKLVEVARGDRVKSVIEQLEKRLDEKDEIVDKIINLLNTILGRLKRFYLLSPTEIAPPERVKFM